MRRTLPLTAALTFALASLGAPAQQTQLPDIGSSAGELATPAQQEEYGGMMLAQLRHYDYILEDPLVESWLDSMGSRLGASSDNSRQSYTFFMMRQREINAFATLGGYIGVNAGLVLAADREDEVAGVLAHEIAHVTQDHVLRAVERAQKDQLPILLAMLGAIVVAQSAGGNSSDDAAQAAMVSGMGLMQQRQIDYTRSNEHEADRLGIQSLARTGYDPMAIADFFGKLQQRSRANGANYYGTDAPEFLMTHPVTTTRISEAKDRARQIAGNSPTTLPAPRASLNPLLPQGLQVGRSVLKSGDTGRFDFARERLRVLSADTPREAVTEYERLAKAGKLDIAQRYGMAIARLRANEPAAAADLLQGLLVEVPGDEWLELAMAEAEAKSGRHAQADTRFESLIQRFPDDRAIALTYARALAERNTVEAGKRAQALLRPQLSRATDDPAFQRTFARASEIAGDPVRAGEAYAEAAFLGGRPEQALVQLNTLKKRPELDYYARARIESRIAAITPVVLELRRLGVRDEVLDRR
ncbi:M48 family metalloprotease [Aerolutibacter ruishenii]|uniref:Putative beta-barrel assembly-enhancing protease n=1 Tax=Aerolutibacter ruishenii TaxID=686800 RepID=A0A562LID5_9GAMM|nr:M48 family metalloprotease [Lysobacter ruishenii]TWI07367.1 putative Zn-dependent protease [Lysobacter ruishenii]